MKALGKDLLIASAKFHPSSSRGHPADFLPGQETRLLCNHMLDMCQSGGASFMLFLIHNRSLLTARIRAKKDTLRGVLDLELKADIRDRISILSAR